MLDLASIVKEVTLFLTQVHPGAKGITWKEYGFVGQGDAAHFIRQVGVFAP
jgi:hypothetical protein